MRGDSHSHPLAFTALPFNTNPAHPSPSPPRWLVARTLRAASAALAVALLAVVGCGPGDNMADVSGTVSYNGEPVADGSISFTPADGKTPTAGGNVKDGKYSCKVPVGPMKVSVTSAKEVGRKKLYGKDGPDMPVMKEVLPEKYNMKTELTYEVKAGSQVKDFPLTK